MKEWENWPYLFLDIGVEMVFVIQPFVCFLLMIFGHASLLPQKSYEIMLNYSNFRRNLSTSRADLRFNLIANRCFNLYIPAGVVSSA